MLQVSACLVSAASHSFSLLHPLPFELNQLHYIAKTNLGVEYSHLINWINFPSQIPALLLRNSYGRAVTQHCSFLSPSYLSVSCAGISSDGRNLSTWPAFLLLKLQEKQQFENNFNKKITKQTVHEAAAVCDSPRLCFLTSRASSVANKVLGKRIKIFVLEIEMQHV